MAAWFPFYFTDYSGKTEHLSLTEHGAYLLLMGAYYKTGKPLPANALQLQRICRAFADAEVCAMNNVLKEFFTLVGDTYVHYRIQAELEKSNDISKKRSNAAKKRHANAGASADANAGASADANAGAKAYTTTTTTTLEEKMPPASKRKQFKKPTLDDVHGYCLERSNHVNAEQFIDHYTSNGWKVGKNPMKDWKAAVRTWEKNRNEKGGQDRRSSAQQTFDKLTDIARKDIEQNGFTDKLD